jgi:putative two-component system response regulator
MRHTILIAEDNLSYKNILEEHLQEKYRILTADKGEKAIKIAQDESIDLILLDIDLPGVSGLDICRTIKSERKTKEIPVIFLTGSGELKNQLAGFEYGAVDYIRKPASLQVINSRISTQLSLYHYRKNLEKIVETRTKDLIKTQQEIVYCLGLAAEYKDNETGMHVKRMSTLAEKLAEQLQFPNERIVKLKNAIPMHDVGKIGIPDYILQKPAGLNKKEWEVMKTHCSIGAKILSGSSSELLGTAKVIAYTHHEKWDGSGYPEGLKGSLIPVEGRIAAICDVYDALISKRPYKEPWGKDETREEMERQKGRHFDPFLLDKFFQIF